MKKLYHRTDNPNEIIDNGFKETISEYMPNVSMKGVFFSDTILDNNESISKGSRVVSIEVDDYIHSTPLESFVLPRNIGDDSRYDYDNYCLMEYMVNDLKTTIVN